MKRLTLASESARRRRFAVSAGAVLAGTALFSVGIAGPAPAAPSHWQTYHGEYGPEVSFCGPGFTQQGVTDGRTRYTAHGPDGLPYYYDRADFTDTWTNLATGEFVTVVGSYQNNALHVTDNGDGTVTILLSGPGQDRMYGEDGELIAHRAGLYQFELLFDQAGTPTDPSDDVFLEHLGTVKNTGLSFDLCATMIQAIG